MNHLTLETGDSFDSVLELAAINDVDGFKRWVERDPSSIDEAGLWYGRQKGSKQMVLEERTPLMVAAKCGSVDVLKHILSMPEINVDRASGLDKSTSLHCAASGGSMNSIDIVKMLLAAGADPNLTDGKGHRPVDVIVGCTTFHELILEKLLSGDASTDEVDLLLSIATSNSYSKALSLSTSPLSSHSGSSTSPKNGDLPVPSAIERKEYPVDPSLPDIKNSIYATDEFRMFSFKVRPCSRAYSHDWTECPFVHPGENARRRDPRKYHYSCVPCPEFRKGTCRKGDMCEYAHGVFECWLHPAQYRTRLCKDGINCNRRVCFFAHAHEELRPLYISTGSAVPSPRAGSSAANAMDFAAMNFLPGSPSSIAMISPSPFTPPPLSSPNGMSNMGWGVQPNVPTLHLPGNSLQSSRLRSSLLARDIPTEDLSMMPDIDVSQQPLFDEMSRLPQSNMNPGSLNRPACPKALTPSNLDELFSVESLSPRYSDQALASGVLSRSPKSAVMNQFQHQQQQQQNMISPINTKSIDHQRLQACYGVASSGRLSPRNMDSISPSGSRVSMLAQREQQPSRVQQHQFRSLSSRDLGSSSSVAVGPPVDAWTNFGGPSMGRPDWAVNNEVVKLKRSSSFELGNEEPDMSWVQSLVTESPQDMRKKSSADYATSAGSVAEGTSVNPQIDQINPSNLSIMLGQMQLDRDISQ